MKNSKVFMFVALVAALVLVGGAPWAMAQWVGPTPTPTTKVFNGAEDSKGKNAKGVEESTEKGSNGGETKPLKDAVPFTLPVPTVAIK